MQPAQATKTSNKARFNEWRSRALAENRHAWQVDTKPDGKNPGDLLMHRGATNGYFLSVDREGTVRLGVYRGARNHISEAKFGVWVCLKCRNYQEGITRIFTACDMTHLIGLFE